MIKFFKKIFGGGDPNRVKCAKCRTELVILSGMMMPTNLMRQAQSCVRCAACGRTECYECCDNRRPCRCGSRQWQERLYISADLLKRVMPDAEIFEAPYVQLGNGPMRGIRNRSPRR